MNNNDVGGLYQFGTCVTDDCIAFMPWYGNATRGYHRFGETDGNDYNFTRNGSIWHHFTGIGRATNGEAVEYYEDSVLRDSYNQSASGENPSLTSFKIGDYNGNLLVGEVDELRFSTTTPTLE
jgi:hypothetical protein